MNEASVRPPRFADRALAQAQKTMTETLLPIAGGAAKRYFGTAAAMAALALALAGSAAFIASPAPWWGVSLAIAVAVAASTIGGVVLAPKRAISGAIVDGLRRAGLGKAVCGLVFDRLLAVSEEEEHGERGVEAAQRAERLPLAAAESRLRAAVDRVARDPGEASGLRAWLRRKIRSALLEQIERVTLARFREDAQAHGGVDLVKVKEELATTIDELLIERFEDAAASTTFLVLGAVVAAALGVAVAVRVLMA